MERVGDVHVAEIGLDSGVGGGELEVDHDAVDEGHSAINEGIVPDLGLAHFDGDGGDIGAHEGGFDAAGLAGVDFEGVWLEELGEALDVGEAEVGVAPERGLTA